MKLDSKYFDCIRVKPGEDRRLRDRAPGCEWPGCGRPGRHRAPKGRLLEGEYYTFCIDHVRDYNKSYNYFEGMPDEAVGDWLRQSATGHRPTWKLGENSWAEARRARAARARLGPFDAEALFGDPHGLFGEGFSSQAAAAAERRSLRNAERKALHTLGLDDTATAQQVKAQYKTLVKRLHPDANGGCRDNEDKLREIIQAYDYLRSSGFA